MFCEIKCVRKDGVTDTDNDYDIFWQFLGALQHNGQILKDYKLIKTENYSLFVTLPKSNSFEEKYDGPYVKRARAELKKYFDYQLIPLGDDTESQEYCCCKKHSAIEMQTFCNDIDSVFTCCDCGKPIALYELPLPDKQEDYCGITIWQENFACMDTIWMNCLCDRYTGGQLTKLDSALNKQGLEVAEDLRKKLNCKVYYNMFDDLGWFGKANKKWQKVGDKFFRICPKCGNNMKLYKKDNFSMMYCEDCQLSSNEY